MNKNPYRVTILGCYLANVIQAVSINLTPLLFLILRKDYDLSYTQFGSLVLANFLTQVTVDLALSRAVDRYGFRPFMVLSHLLCVAGLGLFAAAPELFPGREYTGFLLGTLLFSGSGGLFELLLSPIIDALPSKNGTENRESKLASANARCSSLNCLSSNFTKSLTDKRREEALISGKAAFIPSPTAASACG